MKNDTKEAEKFTELLAQAEGHPMLKAILAEEAAKVLKTRQEAAEKIVQVRKEAERIIPELQAELQVREAELKRHDEDRKVILGKLATARVKLAEAKRDLEKEKSQAEAVLLSNYAPYIDESITFLRDHFYALMRKNPDVQRHKTGTNLFAWRKEFVIYTNMPALRTAMNYIRAAIQELEAMRLLPEVDIKRIETLRQGIPNTDELTEITTDKPMAKDADDVDPLDLLPSDSQIDWEMGKLKEKFKKVTGLPWY